MVSFLADGEGLPFGQLQSRARSGFQPDSLEAIDGLHQHLPAGRLPHLLGAKRTCVQRRVRIEQRVHLVTAQLTALDQRLGHPLALDQREFIRSDRPRLNPR